MVYMEFSLLNQSPILKNHTVKESLQNTINFAVKAESLGYKRFFVSEHHNLKTLIGTAPEVLVSHLAAHTSKMHIGAGGIMLSHHNPFHVAEQFQLINHLADGRIVSESSHMQPEETTETSNPAAAEAAEQDPSNHA